MQGLVIQWRVFGWHRNSGCSCQHACQQQRNKWCPDIKPKWNGNRKASDCNFLMFNTPNSNMKHASKIR